MRLTRRFLVKSLDNISLSNPMRYERYYINDKLRIQRKDNLMANREKFVKELEEKENKLNELSTKLTEEEKNIEEKKRTVEENTELKYENKEKYN